MVFHSGANKTVIIVCEVCGKMDLLTNERRNSDEIIQYFKGDTTYIMEMLSRQVCCWDGLCLSNACKY